MNLAKSMTVIQSTSLHPTRNVILLIMFITNVCMSLRTGLPLAWRWPGGDQSRPEGRGTAVATTTLLLSLTGTE